LANIAFVGQSIVSIAQNRSTIFYERFCSSASADFIFVTAFSIIALITFSGKSERRKAGSFAWKAESTSANFILPVPAPKRFSASHTSMYIIRRA
jgi:hypothetical protein